MSSIQFHWYDYVGMGGVIIILLTYLLLQAGKMTSQSYAYSILNIIGSIMILCSLAYDWNLSAVIIESAWVLISFIGIYRRHRGN